jgi:uncharacterized membrane-anchored protein
MRNPRELAADIEGALGAIVAHGQQQRGVTVRKLLGETEQGFTTNLDRFVDRQQAMLIAKNANQIKGIAEHLELYSEDLW